MANVKQHQIDLLRNYKAKRMRELHEKKNVAMKTGMIAFSIVAIGLLSGGYVWQKTNLDNINAQVAEYEVLLSDSELLANNAQMLRLEKIDDSLAELLSVIQNQTEKIALMENKFEYLKEDFFDNIYACCGDTIEMVKYEVSGYYFIGGFVTDNSLNIPHFVARLRETGIFSEIAYEGFDYEQESDDLPIEYQFTLHCVFKTGGDAQ